MALSVEGVACVHGSPGSFRFAVARSGAEGYHEVGREIRWAAEQQRLNEAPPWMGEAPVVTLDRYRSGLAAHFGVSVGLFGTLGSVVVPAPSRSGSGRVSHHHIGRHSLIWTDPELEPELADWHRRRTPIAFDELRTAAQAARAELLGHGLEHVLSATYQPGEWAPEVTVLDGASPAGISIVRTLLDACSEEDLDEAEFEIDALDPYLVGWNEGGRLLALAGGRPEDFRPECMDLGVLVHPEARRGGRGRAVVAAAADLVLDAGHVPLYRCGSSNVGSQRLCRAVGFELVMELDAFQWVLPPPPVAERP